MKGVLLARPTGGPQLAGRLRGRAGVLPAEHASDRWGSGTGLGLAIAQRLSQALGGQIEFARELPTRAKSLDDALQRRNHEGLAALALQLKGTAEIYGFIQIADRARALHDLAQAEGDWQQFRHDVAAIAGLCEQLSSAQEVEAGCA